MPAFPPMPGDRRPSLGTSGSHAIPEFSPSLNPLALGEVDRADKTRMSGVAAVGHATAIATAMRDSSREIHANEKYSIPERHRLAAEKTAQLAKPFLDTFEKSMALYERDIKRLHEKLDAPEGSFSELALTDARVKLSGIPPQQRVVAIKKSIDKNSDLLISVLTKSDPFLVDGS